MSNVDPQAASEQAEAFKQQVQAGDAAGLARWLAEHPQFDQINAPLFPFGSRATHAAKNNQPLLAVLLDHGADINLKSDWWAGGFGVLDWVSSEVAEWLASRGAVLDIFAAARHGRLERVKELVESDPALVHAKGGDGQRPLHYASTRDIVDYLLEKGADIDARCVDHASTAIQWGIKQQWKVRHLIERGAGIDIFLAAYLDDVALIERAIAEEPGALSARIGKEGYSRCPMEAAGTIYQWELGFHFSPIEVAGRYGRKKALAVLTARSGPAERFLAACLMGDEAGARQVLSEKPGLMGDLSSEDRLALHHAVCASNLPSAQLMLELGFDVNSHREDGEKFTPLAQAALRGNLSMVKLLVQHGADVNAINGYGSNPLGVCLWGSLNFKDPAGDYPGVAGTLLAAGSKPPEKPWGSADCQAALQKHVSLMRNPHK
jgi:ankyrin repeat protein